MRTRSTLASLAAVLAVGALALTGCATSSAPALRYADDRRTLG